MRFDVILVGAGIGGLTAALALQQQRVRVAICEQAGEPFAGGAGLVIGASGTRVLEQLGLREVLDDLAVRPAHLAIRHFQNGRLLAETTPDSAARVQIGRADLQRALLAAVQSNDRECLHPGHALADIGQDAGGVSALFAGRQMLRGSLLVACDGLRSAIRMRLFGDEQPRFTGYQLWQGLVPMSHLAPAAPGLGDADTWIGPGQQLGCRRIGRGSQLAWLALARSNRWSEEDWQKPSGIDSVLAAFRNFDTLARTVLMATPREQSLTRGIFLREPLPAWTQGRVALLGDAAHPLAPFIDQATDLALEDAFVLARAIAAAGTTPEALQRYAAARIPRASASMVAAEEQGVRLTTLNPDTHVAGATHDSHYDPVTVPV
ncbi:MAG: FAD-dependent monooxygenase [Gammaproteobacteria bacterium]|nr:FAD-dependent monooxygenase [Gammaproteobacteria bacterium]